MEDIMYLDYFNGMSDLANVNTIRLYRLEGNGNTSSFICSAPFTENLAYTITHDYGGNAASLLGNILKKFSEGLKQGSLMLGGAMSLVNQLGDLTGINSLQEFTNSDNYRGIMNNAMKNGMKKVVMPWEGAKVYTSSENSITQPNIKFSIASSKSFAEYFQKMKDSKGFGSITNTDNGNATKTSKFIVDLKPKKNTSTNIDSTANTGNNSGGLSQTPVKDYLEYLLNKIGGFIGDASKTKKDLFALNFQNPTNDNQAAKMSDAIKNGYDLRMPDKGTLWAAIGDNANPIILKSLFPKSINIVPSKYHTPTGDYLWAEISIELEWSKMIITDVLKDTLFNTQQVDDKISIGGKDWSGDWESSGNTLTSII